MATIPGVAWCLAWSLILLWVPKLADKIGRKRIFVLSRLLDCVCFGLIISTKSYAVVVAACAGFGLASAGRFNVGNVYLSEWFPTKYQTMIQVVRLIE